MGVIILKAKTHEEWLKNREGGIGASQVGTIMNCNPYESQYGLWEVKHGLKKVEENENMLLGHLFEDAVAQRYAIATGNTIIKASASEDVYVNEEKPFMRVSPDRLYICNGEKKSKKNYRLLECKTAGINNPIDAEEPPLNYYCQVQYQMHVTGIKKATLAWINLGTRTFGYRDFDYDEQFCLAMEKKVEEWYNKYVIGDEVPTIKTPADFSTVYPKSVEGKTKEADTEDVELANKLREVKAAIKAYESNEEYTTLLATEKELTDKLKMTMTDNELLVKDGVTLATYKSAKDKVTFDDKKAVEIHPELKDLYTSKPGTRSFLFKLK